VTRTEQTAEALRELAAKGRDAAQVRRLLAIALILEGRSRTEAAAQSGMDRQTLRDGVHHDNAAGVAGLCSRRSPGRAPALGQTQMDELKQLVIQGPDPDADNVVRWRCLDLRDKVAERFTVTVHERTIGTWLRKLALTPAATTPFSSQEGCRGTGDF
jgi:transposase